jgi:hypothetical protein
MRVPITSLQPVDSRGWIVARIGPGQWDMRSPGLVYLSSASGRVRLRCTGYGEAGGDRLLTLVPLPGDDTTASEIVAAVGGVTPIDAFIERATSAADPAVAEKASVRA